VLEGLLHPHNSILYVQTGLLPCIWLFCFQEIVVIFIYQPVHISDFEP
jgi:hypothetical protein